MDGRDPQLIVNVGPAACLFLWATSSARLVTMRSSDSRSSGVAGEVGGGLAGVAVHPQFGEHRNRAQVTQVQLTRGGLVPPRPKMSCSAPSAAMK